MAEAVSAAWPWGRPLTWPEIQGGERALVLAADAAVCAAVARNHDLESLARLEARITVRPWLDGAEFNGRVTAQGIRLCGLSLEPFDFAVDEALHLRIVPQGSPNVPQGGESEIVFDLDSEDPPDEASGATIDISAYVVETFALALDPFPRKPGAVFTQPDSTGSLSPFSVLARLRDPSEGD